MKAKTNTAPAPKITRFLENLLFGHRILILSIFLIVTIFLGSKALQIRPAASFLRMIPAYHPFIQNFIAHKEDLKGMGNVIRVSVETTEGDIFSKSYLETLRNVTDEIFYINGVDRSGLKSLWTPNTMWMEVTARGFDVGPIIPDGYDGSSRYLDQVQANVVKSGEIGRLVANNLKSTIVQVPLLEIDAQTGKALNYKEFSQKLESLIRDKYQNDTIKIHITGFAKVVGDLIEGAGRVVLFFFVALIIMLAILYYASRCWKCTLLRGAIAILAVVWQLGVLSMLGYGLNPYSMLVPFLILALVISHGTQLTNAMTHEMCHGFEKEEAARRSFRAILMPGTAALFTDCIGFATLFVIQIGVIQDIAIGASIGVGVVFFINLILFPVLMSYGGITETATDKLTCTLEDEPKAVWKKLSNFTKHPMAVTAVIISFTLLGAGLYLKQDLKIGDLDPGASELKPDSRYNLDNAFMNENYGTSSDVFVVMLKTPAEANSNYETVNAVSDFTWQLKHTKGVQNVMTYVDVVKRMNAAMNEGNLKWNAIPRNKSALDSLAMNVPLQLAKKDGTMSPLIIFLNDHKAETLEGVVAAVQAFADKNNTDEVQFLMAAGNAGIEAATNIEIEKAQLKMMLLVFSVVIIVCLLTFRNIGAVVCIIFPLYLTTVLSEALMAKLGIGIKVATLPVIAVGVGIGVDYGIYIYSKLKSLLDQGQDLHTAYFNTLQSTGRAVGTIGIIMAIGVSTWVFSPIKFQADMGILLTFMFLCNMVGSMTLLPAVGYFLVKHKNSTAADMDPSELECSTVA